MSTNENAPAPAPEPVPAPPPVQEPPAPAPAPVEDPAAPAPVEAAPAATDTPAAPPAQAGDDAQAGEAGDTADPSQADETADASQAGEPGASAAPEAKAPDCGPLLAQRFPALFGGPHPKPLKLRIQADIHAAAPGAFSKAQLSAFFRRHTRTTAYLIGLTREPHRYDLDGQPAGEIAAEHREAAEAELAVRRARRDEKRAAEQAAYRQRIDWLRASASQSVDELAAAHQLTPAQMQAALTQARAEAEARAARRATQPPRAPRPADGGARGERKPAPAGERPPGGKPDAHGSRPPRPPRREGEHRSAPRHEPRHKPRRDTPAQAARPAAAAPGGSAMQQAWAAALGTKESKS